MSILDRLKMNNKPLQGKKSPREVVTRGGLEERPRSNADLEEMMYGLWDDYFSDVPRKNLVLIHFGKKSKRQLGCIRWVHGRSKVKGIYRKKSQEHEVQDDKRISQITITGYFRDLAIPDQIIRMVIAHEMVHYTHGFHSPLPKLYSNPHKGNIVNKELIKRGLKEELEMSEKWIKDNWVTYLKTHRS